MIPDKKRFGYSRVLSAFTKIDPFLVKNAKKKSLFLVNARGSRSRVSLPRSARSHSPLVYSYEITLSPKATSFTV